MQEVLGLIQKPRTYNLCTCIDYQVTLSSTKSRPLMIVEGRTALSADDQSTAEPLREWHISKRRLKRRCESNRPTQIATCLEYRSTIRFHWAPIQATPKPYLRPRLVYGHKPFAAPVSLHLEQVFLRHLLHWDLHISTATHLAKDPTNLLASQPLFASRQPVDRHTPFI